jgi:hypothetical protein
MQLIDNKIQSKKNFKRSKQNKSTMEDKTIKALNKILDELYMYINIENELLPPL